MFFSKRAFNALSSSSRCSGDNSFFVTTPETGPFSVASLNFILFRFSLPAKKSLGFVNLTFDNVAFRHLTKKCFANQGVDRPIPPDIPAANRRIFFLGLIYLHSREALGWLILPGLPPVRPGIIGN